MSTPSSAYNELISAQLRKATTELRNIQQLLTDNAIDVRVLLDFREAVDNVRHVAWAVQQWLDLRERKQDVSTVMEVLLAHRIRVATQLNNDLALTFEAGELTPEFPGVASLLAATGRLQGFCSHTSDSDRADG